MKQKPVRIWLIFCAALVLGVLLHFLYRWLPSPVTALLSPVRESLWEHLKVVLYPLLLSGLLIGGRRAITPWLCALLIACSLLLLVGWIYHIPLRGDALWFDLGLYLAVMLLGFLLPRVLWPLTEWPGVGAACAILTLLLLVLMAVFTFSPPAGALFADLSAARTFFTIPV